jgi:putative transposase
VVKPAARRLAAVHLKDAFGVSERRAIQVLRLHRSTGRYVPRPERFPELRQRMRKLAIDCPKCGYRMMTDRLRWEGTLVNHKRVYRVYREEGLQLPKRRRKKLRSVRRQPLLQPEAMNVRWSMDFMSDSFADGRRFRVFNVVDDFTRESLAIEVGTSFPGSVVTRVLDRIAQERGYPTTIVCDNGPEFRSRDMDAWAFRHSVQIHFIDPGKPTQNAFVESFNDKFRSECLNCNWFFSLDDARKRVITWRHEYNELRPHRSIGRIPPAAFSRRAAALHSPPAPSAPPPMSSFRSTIGVGFANS